MGNGVQPQLPSLPPLAQAKCLSCQADFIVNLPPPRVINGFDFTTIMFIHPKPDKCANCGTEYIFRVVGVDNNAVLRFDWVPVKTEQSAIVPGTDSNLTQAVKNDAVSKKIKLQ